MAYKTYILHLDDHQVKLRQKEIAINDQKTHKEFETYYQDTVLSIIENIATDYQSFINPPVASFNPRTSQLTITCSPDLYTGLCRHFKVKTSVTCDHKINPLKFNG